MSNLPSPSELAPIVITVLDNLGGKAHFKDIEREVARLLHLDEPTKSMIRTGTRTEFAYRLSWARTACKNQGKIRNLGKGIWERVSS